MGVWKDSIFRVVLTIVFFFMLENVTGIHPGMADSRYWCLCVFSYIPAYAVWKELKYD